MKHKFITSAVIGGTLMMSLPAHADNLSILREKTSALCAAGDRDTSAESARKNIESHVARAEAAIQPPIPIGDLACLNDLMNFDLSVLSSGMFNLDSLFSGLTSGLDLSVDGIIDATGEAVSKEICSFVDEKWKDLTDSLDLSADDLNDMIGGVGDSIADIGDNMNFGSINLGSGGGSFDSEILTEGSEVEETTSVQGTATSSSGTSLGDAFYGTTSGESFFGGTSNGLYEGK